MALKLYDPDLGSFSVVDPGAQSTTTLLLNILIEMRVQTMLIAESNKGVLADDLYGLRNDVINEPQSLTQV